jgi:hypothetical protein
MTGASLVIRFTVEMLVAMRIAKRVVNGRLISTAVYASEDQGRIRLHNVMPRKRSRRTRLGGDP